MRRLVVVRHAQSEWNASGRWQGWADPPLSALGRQQADQAGEALAAAGVGVDVVVSSDLVRAETSAAAVSARAFPTVQRSTDAGWREYRVGAWSGLTRAEIDEGWPGVRARYDAGDIEAAPGGERRTDFEARLLAALDALVTRRPADGTALVVTHGGCIRALARALGDPVHHVGNLAGLILEVGGDLATVAGTVDLLADVSPLAP